MTIIKKSRFSLCLTLGVTSLFGSLNLSAQVANSKQGWITPSEEPNVQQQGMINRRYGMFIHFGINTFSGQEWTNGTLSPDIYNPTELDTDQWAKTAKDAGMTYVILITKHHEGFCLWDSPYTKYDVGSSPVKTDVVKAMAASCKKYGIKLGLYYSLWDRNWKNGIMRGTNNNLTDAQSDEYVDYMKKQLTELLTNYGDICELWFDGGWIHPREDWQIEKVYAHIKKLQPNCLVGVNWSIGKVGNLDANPSVKPPQYKKGLPIRYFPSEFRLGDPELPVFPDVKLFSGPDKKLYYMPFETTVCLNTKWFWHPDDKGLRSVNELLPLYERCTAQKNVLILNSPPNRKGLMDDRNIKRLKELALALGATPGKSVPANIAEESTASSDSVWDNNHKTYGAANAVDANPNTRWASKDKKTSISLVWKKPRAVDMLRVREYGENNVFRIKAFTVEAQVKGQWKTVHTGTTIGFNKVIHFAPIKATAIRINIKKSSLAPSLYNISAGCAQ